MVMRAGKNGQAQKMGKRVTDERSLTPKLFETLMPGWLLMCAAEALSKHLGGNNWALPQLGDVTQDWTRRVQNRYSDRTSRSRSLAAITRDMTWSSQTKM